MCIVGIADIKPFHGEKVIIKTRDPFGTKKYFTYFGILDKFNAEHIKIRLLKGTGFRILELEDIIGIKSM